MHNLYQLLSTLLSLSLIFNIYTVNAKQMNALSLEKSDIMFSNNLDIRSNKPCTLLSLNAAHKTTIKDKCTFYDAIAVCTLKNSNGVKSKNSSAKKLAYQQFIHEHHFPFANIARHIYLDK